MASIKQKETILNHGQLHCCLGHPSESKTSYVVCAHSPMKSEVNVLPHHPWFWTLTWGSPISLRGFWRSRKQKKHELSWQLWQLLRFLTPKMVVNDHLWIQGNIYIYIYTHNTLRSTTYTQVFLQISFLLTASWRGTPVKPPAFPPFEWWLDPSGSDFPVGERAPAASSGAAPPAYNYTPEV